MRAAEIEVIIENMELILMGDHDIASEEYAYSNVVYISNSCHSIQRGDEFESRGSLPKEEIRSEEEWRCKVNQYNF